MPYELTSLFTAVASASASFVAILGGFIAGKLISINGNREAVIAKLTKIEQQQSFKQSELLGLQRIFDEQNALSFINENIDAIINRKKLSDVYRSDIQQVISREDLTPYWNRALNLLGELLNAFEAHKDGETLNEDHLPSSFAEKYCQDHFAYSISSKIMHSLDRQRGYNDYLGVIPNLDSNYFVAEALSTKMDTSKIDELKAELKWIKIQREQLIEEKKSLSKPKGMKAGLIIFAFFSLFCIVLPLVLSPLSVDSLCTFWILKSLILVLLVAGLFSVFTYLAFLLNWGENSKNEHK